MIAFVRPSHRLQVAAAGIATVGALSVLAVANPEQGGFPRCPFVTLTGWSCPGCGTLRALHALTHLDVARAFSFNALAMLAIPVLAFAFVRWARSGVALRIQPWMPRTLLVLVATFAVVRNLPFGQALAP